MLFFEFFPMFVTIVSTVVAVGLFVVNRRVRRDPAEEAARRRDDARRAEAARARLGARPEPTIVRRPSVRS